MGRAINRSTCFSGRAWLVARRSESGRSSGAERALGRQKNIHTRAQIGRRSIPKTLQCLLLSFLVVISLSFLPLGLDSRDGTGWSSLRSDCARCGATRQNMHDPNPLLTKPSTNPAHIHSTTKAAMYAYTIYLTPDSAPLHTPLPTRRIPLQARLLLPFAGAVAVGLLWGRAHGM